MHQGKKLKYNLNWAKKVHQEFLVVYARAAEDVNKIYGIPNDLPPYWLAMGVSRWRNWRRIVKTWDCWRKTTKGLNDLNPKLLNYYVVLLKKRVKNDFYYHT